MSPTMILPVYGAIASLLAVVANAGEESTTPLTLPFGYPNAQIVYLEAPEVLYEYSIEAACIILSELVDDFECPEVLPRTPTILFTDMDSNTYGLYYLGYTSVYINVRMVPKWGVFGQGVVVHELVHFLTYWHIDPDMSSCDSEDLAWKAFNSYVEQVGRPDLINLDWKKGYPLCQTNLTTPSS